jgi:hypothetical protein
MGGDQLFLLLLKLHIYHHLLRCGHSIINIDAKRKSGKDILGESMIGCEVIKVWQTTSGTALNSMILSFLILHQLERNSF